MLWDVADPINSWIKHGIKHFVLFLKFYDHKETFVDLSYMYFLHLSNFKGQSVSGTGYVVVSTEKIKISIFYLSGEKGMVILS